MNPDTVAMVAALRQGANPVAQRDAQYAQGKRQHVNAQAQRTEAEMAEDAAQQRWQQRQHAQRATAALSPATAVVGRPDMPNEFIQPFRTAP